MAEQRNTEEFVRKFFKVYEKNAPVLDMDIKILLVGKVSTGKSSLLNALLYCERNDPVERNGPVAKVGAESGVTMVITGDSAALILITAKMCQSLSRDVFNQNTEKIDWRAWVLGGMQFPLGVVGIKALLSLIPGVGSAANAAVSFATVETIGWAAYRLFDDGKELDKISKEDFEKALDWAKQSKKSKEVALRNGAHHL